MASLSISKIGQKIFTPKTNFAKSTNPFAASSFKGNILTADVFETAKIKRNKLKYSALVGSIGTTLGDSCKKAVESVVAFGNRMKESFGAAYNKINDIGNIELDFSVIGKSVKSGFNSMVDRYSVSRLKKYDVNTLENMWKDMTKLDVMAV